MTTLEAEQQTRVVPWSAREFGWARTRDPGQRVRAPVRGQRVAYRHDNWGPVIDGALVVDAPDPGAPPGWDDLPPGEDLDINVWDVVCNVHGEPLLDGGGAPIVRAVPDPWPLITLRVPGRVELIRTREARLRGSSGWLPLDWRSRWRPGPHHGWAPGRRGRFLDAGLKYPAGEVIVDGHRA